MNHLMTTNNPKILTMAGTAMLMAMAMGCGDYNEGPASTYPGEQDAYYNNQTGHAAYGSDGEQGREDDHIDFGENEFIEASEEDTSTFSIDVNTASYTMARRALNEGRLPVEESVRIEEFINYFNYDYPEPGDEPFSLHLEMGPSYFGSEGDEQRHLMRLGINGQEVSIDDMKPTNLVFLVDVSGSMNRDDRLPLAKESLHTLVENLRDSDRVAMQTYASGSETVLEPMEVGGNRQEVGDAIESLVAQGSTWGEGGIRDAYALAEQGFIEGGNNRVVILTDGDFNVGATGDELVDLVKSYRDMEISLTSVGYGHGGFGDATMERLARKGNGNYFYVDTIDEAQRIFGEKLTSTVEIIAEDVRTQVVFNEDAVHRYRLIGYEKRVMDNEDFDDEDTNAGELGAGHQVTAFYELELLEESEEGAQLAELRLRHRAPYGDETELQTGIIKRGYVSDDFDEMSKGYRFATAVVQLAAILRGSQFVDEANFGEVYDIADASRYDGDAQQAEFLELVNKADELWESGD